MAVFGARLRRINAHNFSTLRSNPLSELSGSLGDLGTLLPLLIALTLTKSISLSATLVFSGITNILTGVAFGIPLPVQPMKAIAAIAISQSYTKEENTGAGLFMGGIVTLLSLTGLLRWFGRVVPVPVVRGIQMGAGLALVISAGTSLLKPLGWVSPTWSDNWLWACGAFVFLLIASLGARIPYALIVFAIGLVLAGIALATAQHPPGTTAPSGFQPWRPRLVVPSPRDFRKGAIEAGLPQLPLTTLNSVLAVTSLSASLFPRFPGAPSNTELGLSVGVANLVGCWFGAMPVCHGSGGLAGQYRFGARSGASIIILGLVKLVLGLVAGESIIPVLERFPKSLLGVMVLAAGVELAKVGQSLDDVDDLWEEAEQDNEDALQERDKRARRNEQERRDRWAVMLITVAGCLAFKNDAVGFIAGMLWHWGLRMPELTQRWRSSRGHRRLTRFFTAREEHDESEGEGLLDRNHDAPEGRTA
ncbi:hypothetical protein MBLNU459_g2242t1 [Dothideomycetes sp. NU459]